MHLIQIASTASNQLMTSIGSLAQSVNQKRIAEYILETMEFEAQQKVPENARATAKSLVDDARATINQIMQQMDRFLTEQRSALNTRA